MCIEAIFSSNSYPIISSPSTASEERHQSSSFTRLALSVTSIALAVFSTATFLATNSVIALGLSVGLCIAAVCLLPKSRGSRISPSIVPPPINTVFGAPLYIPRRDPWIEESFHPPIFTLPSSNRRIHVGDHERTPSTPMIIPQGRLREDRVRVGDRQFINQQTIPSDEERINVQDRRAPGIHPGSPTGNSRVQVGNLHH